jgi:hypothetical protein
VAVGGRDDDRYRRGGSIFTLEWLVKMTETNDEGANGVVNYGSNALVTGGGGFGGAGASDRYAIDPPGSGSRLPTGRGTETLHDRIVDEIRNQAIEEAIEHSSHDQHPRPAACR